MDKKLMILICFFSVITFISSVLCSCLVYYNEKARTNINGNKVLVSNSENKSSSIEYYQNNVLSFTNLSPGYILEQNFSISNNNSKNLIYDIVWTNVKSTWGTSESGIPSHPEEFTYTLSCSDGQKIEKETMPLPNTDNIIIKNQSLKTNKTNNCTIKITFESENYDQSYNLNKVFSGTYKVVIKE